MGASDQFIDAIKDLVDQEKFDDIAAVLEVVPLPNRLYVTSKIPGIVSGRFWKRDPMFDAGKFEELVPDWKDLVVISAKKGVLAERFSWMMARYEESQRGEGKTPK